MLIYKLIADHYDKKTEKLKREVIKKQWELVQMQKEFDKMKKNREVK